jgi:hypothetical protein
MPWARESIQDARVRALPPVPTSGPIRSPEENSSAQLVAEVTRLLREQMDAMHRQQQMREPDLELPEYTLDYSGISEVDYNFRVYFFDRDTSTFI